MKHTYKFILLSLATLLPVLANAQDPAVYNGYHGVETGVATGKTVTPNDNGTYTIKLETFATGNSVITEKSIPSDIVLVLDYSSSMLMSGSGNPPSSYDYLYSLKNAVGTFVTSLKNNNAELDLKPGQVGNRIAFVLYAGVVYDEFSDVNPNATSLSGISGDGDDGQLTHYRFYGKHLNNFISVDNLTVGSTTETHPVNGRSYTSSSVSYTVDDVDIISPSSQRAYALPGYSGLESVADIGDVNKGTHSQMALEKARDIAIANLSTYEEGERNTTVVFFTDGSPSATYQGQSNWSQSYAEGAIDAAKEIKDEDIKDTVKQVADFFELPVPIIKERAETIAEVITSDKAEECQLYYDWREMEKSGINNREALKLACLHELAHQYLYKTRFLLFENELWIQELAADLLVGAFSVLNGDVATGKYKFVVSGQKVTLTHPDGKLREEVVIYGRKYVEQLLQQKRYQGIKDILTGLPAFVYSHYQELQESWDKLYLEDEK